MLKESPTFSTVRTPSSYPASHKRYLQGARVRVPYREITLSDTHHGDYAEANPPLPVYDTSDPYTDPEVGIRLTRGLPALRRDWIKEREDSETLTGRSSEYARGRENDLLTFHLRFPSPPISQRARRGENLSQMHYARKGIITPEMEFVALRESMQLRGVRGEIIRLDAPDVELRHMLVVADHYCQLGSKWQQSMDRASWRRSRKDRSLREDSCEHVCPGFSKRAAPGRHHKLVHKVSDAVSISKEVTECRYEKQ